MFWFFFFIHDFVSSQGLFLPRCAREEKQNPPFPSQHASAALWHTSPSQPAGGQRRTALLRLLTLVGTILVFYSKIHFSTLN